MMSQLGFLNERLFVAVTGAVYDLVLTIVALCFILYQMDKPGFYDRFGNQLAMGIACHMVGETLNRGWGAALLWLYALGFDIAPLENAYPVAFLGSFISFAGVLCKLRVFSPDWMSRWLWVITMMTGFVCGALAVASTGTMN